MTRIVHLNGQWLPETEARISIFDRGFLFADAIYEVTAVIGGKLVDYAAHAARLKRSLHEIGLGLPCAEEQMLALHREIVVRNDLKEGLIYLQISRGAEDRDFIYHDGLAPTFVMFTQARNVLGNPRIERGLKVVTAPDRRWSRRDIKTTQLLYPSLVKTAAHGQGADDVFLVEDGLITEASGANVHIIDRSGTLITRALSQAILPGITRASVLEIARAGGIPVEERGFSVAEAQAAAECFLSSATSFVMPVVEIDGQPISDGAPGPLTRRLRALYLEDRLAAAI
ncbi:D-alanine aminotransferase [Rhodovastum atsumiense]|uniref:Probable branched-chain-amino-acid aminotransferase n=1 Tax=Rhodovastum atsumiense TaxID=504468 RepID=A0A5M6IV33_9PROT|nr:D-amino-acid transaminase [Rhodovastum atsumiense]KAA5612164.1 D-amino-acid transaminase [Rhodovastum atsumiense]CAH2603887.1 D-alanine aminotransferase [Rhodovastum atsumiense]